MLKKLIKRLKIKLKENKNNSLKWIIKSNNNNEKRFSKKNNYHLHAPESNIKIIRTI